MSDALFLRPCVIAGETAPDDYSVVEDSRIIGRIYCTTGHRPEAWVWSVTVDGPHIAHGRAATLDEAKAEFRAAWEAVKKSRRP